MIWIVLAFIFSNLFTGFYCYIKGLAKALAVKNGTKEQKEDEHDKEEATS
jgi:hypothetical protein